jgi:hypothetical protein
MSRSARVLLVAACLVACATGWRDEKLSTKDSYPRDVGSSSAHGNGKQHASSVPSNPFRTTEAFVFPEAVAEEWAVRAAAFEAHYEQIAAAFKHGLEWNRFGLTVPDGLLGNASVLSQPVVDGVLQGFCLEPRPAVDKRSPEARRAILSYGHTSTVLPRATPADQPAQLEDDALDRLRREGFATIGAEWGFGRALSSNGTLADIMAALDMRAKEVPRGENAPLMPGALRDGTVAGLARIARAHLLRRLRPGPQQRMWAFIADIRVARYTVTDDWPVS